MTNVAGYHAIQDSSITLSFFGRNEEKFVEFHPPNDIILASTGVDRPVLSYRVDPSNDAKDLLFKVFIGQFNMSRDVEVSSIQLNGTVSRTVFEIINGSQLQKRNQKIIFKLLSGVGSVTVSDVIFWFMRTGVSFGKPPHGGAPSVPASGF